MITKIAIVWVLGLLTIVLYGTYYLLYYAERDQYAWLITLVLFWIFGFWGIVTPILVIIKSRRVFRVLEKVDSKEKLIEILHTQDSLDVAIDLIAWENKIPKFLTKKIYFFGLKKFQEKVGSEQLSVKAGK